METRIIARYLIKEGFNEIDDRDVDLDGYKEVEVKTVDQGMKACLNEVNGNGIGTVYEQKETKYGWEDVHEHHVENGVIYRTEEL